MSDLKHAFRENYLQYASYVILDRAIPHLTDGLKPVQRRILWTLFQMDDHKMHKVANIAGQTMALHPHGDAPIVEALVHLANKGFLLDTQGNFGNPLTGDPHAAGRYIEARLSSLAKETLFNPHLMNFLPSYDGRHQEPELLAAKIPLLLLLGAEGIAVGMATKILPHNFVELLQAEIALLTGKPFTLFPDFAAGGSMDPSDYQEGFGKIKVQAKIEIVDDKTLLIKEICHGTTTESLIRSIDEAAKKGKVKIESIHDYTAETIAIEIKLSRGHYAHKTRELLYAFSECSIVLHPQMLFIKEGRPHEATVRQILEWHTEQLQRYLEAELRFEQQQLLEKIFAKTLEQIFIEERLYKRIEELETYEKIDQTIEKGLQPFYGALSRIPEAEDRSRLLEIPIRRISRFDRDKNQEEIGLLRKKWAEIDLQLKNIKKVTIKYLEGLLKKYGPLFPRRTQIQTIAELDKRALSAQSVQVNYDQTTGFVGTKVSGAVSSICSSLDKLLLLYEDGSYKVISIPEKQYVHSQEAKLAWMGRADKETVLNLLYQDERGIPYGKRFVVKQYILDKQYYFLDPKYKLMYVTSKPQASVVIELVSLKASSRRQKPESLLVAFEEIPIKGVSARGVRLAQRRLANLKES